MSPALFELQEMRLLDAGASHLIRRYSMKRRRRAQLGHLQKLPPTHPAQSVPEKAFFPIPPSSPQSAAQGSAPSSTHFLVTVCKCQRQWPPCLGSPASSLPSLISALTKSTINV